MFYGLVKRELQWLEKRKRRLEQQVQASADLRLQVARRFDELTRLAEVPFLLFKHLKKKVFPFNAHHQILIE